MKKSKRFFLPADDFDVSLIKAQMSQQFVHGLGFCGSTKDAIIDPAEIIGGIKPSETARTVRDENRRVLEASMGK